MTWTVNDIPDLTGKTILITGANSGVGFYAAKLFAERNAQVILACRNPKKMAAAADAIRNDVPSADLVQMVLDVSDLDNVRAFAKTFKASGISKIDVLLLNAGIAAITYGTSKQGYELGFATNHLGHFLLTGLLLDYITAVPNSRVIAVSSVAHKFYSSINYEVARGNAPRDFNYIRVYSETKLANQWFIRKLQEKLAASGAKTTAVCTHPGSAHTDIGRYTDESWMAKILYYLFERPLNQSAADGAWPLAMAATDADIRPENYYGPKYWFENKGPPVSNCKLAEAVFDDAKARELWEISEELTGYTYSI